MARSTLPTRRSYRFDKSLELRDYASVAIAASTNGADLAFPATKQMDYKAIVNAASYSAYVANTAQWSVAIEASADGITFKQVGTSVVLIGDTQVEIALSGAGVEDVVPNAEYLRVVATKTGTPGNLTFGAFISPSK